MKRLAIAVLAIAMLGAQESRPAMPPPVQQYVKACVRATDARAIQLKTAVPELEKEIAVMKKGAVEKLLPTPKIKDDNGGYRFRSKEDKQKEIKSAEQRLDTLRRERREIEAGTFIASPSLDAANIEVGEAGVFAAQKLVPVNRGGVERNLALPRTPRTMQIIDDSNMLITVEIVDGPGESHTSEPIWVRGVSTAGMVDNKAIDLSDRAFCVVDPVRYDAITGQRTVACIEAIDMSKWRPAIEAEVRSIRKPVP